MTMTSHNIANFTMKSSSLHLLIALGVYEVLVNAISDSPPPPCSSYNIDSKVLELEPPTLNPNSAIGQVFEALEGQLQAVLVPQPTGPACYEWTCQSNERKGENCRWCLPAIFVGGIAKCGTTALCDKLVTHPDVRFYRAKETNIFTKMHFSIAGFEKYTKDNWGGLNNETSRGHHDASSSNISVRFLKKGLLSPGRHVGNMWLDCSAGAFRDFNAAAYLRKYSPDTKVVLIVRDPWQTIGSRMSQQTRYGRSAKSQLSSIRSQFRRLQFPPEDRFGPRALLRLAKGTDYAYGEKLLYWRAAFPSPESLLLLDQFDLQHHAKDTMFGLETFLNLQHVNYSNDTLQGISHNAYSKGMRGSSNEPEASILNRTSNSLSTTEHDVVIHKPYSFSHEKEFLSLSRNVLHPSLCLFEKIFGWKIHITTESEMNFWHALPPSTSGS